MDKRILILFLVIFINGLYGQQPFLNLPTKPIVITNSYILTSNINSSTCCNVNATIFALNKEYNDKKSKRLRNVGISFTSIGFVGILTSVLYSRISCKRSGQDNEEGCFNITNVGITMPTAILMFSIGFPNLGIGIHRMRKAQ